ncbi:hypothetical protein D3273_13445 [Lichenibacterium minor]|uniref:Uncharacterized protein n=1 Tax=Lichenibacterium minor TaxID=2316528 RepID=A0A4Q2U6A3_9HYPH|nr:hypothetical protein [Lichenibacterium minor]RYC31388.1 hypothetical protein D3273_13445 [Lichenibacterium minor]
MNGEITASSETTPATAPEGRDVIREATGSRNAKWGSSLLNRTLGTLSDVRKAEDKEARAALVGLTMDSLAAFAPKNPVEGMIAAQAVALHQASMECLRRAMIPEQPAEVAAKLRKDGANLGRGFTDMLDALARHRGKGPQVVRVERVVVQDGGQAIVGAVATGRAGGE